MTVLDVNDNVPEWIMAPSPYLAVVSPDAPAGSMVYKLHAKDGDEGNNGEVEYFLSDGRSFLLQVSLFFLHADGGMWADECWFTKCFVFTNNK